MAVGGPPSLTTQSPAASTLAPLVAAPVGDRPARGGGLPEPLAIRYGGDLAISLHDDRPTVVANFVSTIDGVVSYATPEQAGGGEISGFFEPDRFVMGLLRALADVVLIGAGTLRAAPDERWTPDYIHPSSAAGFGDLRARLGLDPWPATAIVTASGELDFGHPGLADPAVPVLVLTTDRGRRSLAAHRQPDHVAVETLASERVEMGALLGSLHQRKARLVVCEGGPHLLGELLRASALDELFLTIAPQLAGRASATPRLGLVEGTAFALGDAPWLELLDLRRCGNHLFARYRAEGEGR